MCKIGEDGVVRIKSKLPTPACWDNGIKMDVAVYYMLLFFAFLFYSNSIPSQHN